MTRIGLLGGSFNPAHRGHRRISAFALRALQLDEMWWLVSPGNPLKKDAATRVVPSRSKGWPREKRRARGAVRGGWAVELVTAKVYGALDERKLDHDCS